MKPTPQKVPRWCWRSIVSYLLPFSRGGKLYFDHFSAQFAFCCIAQGITKVFCSDRHRPKFSSSLFLLQGLSCTWVWITWKSLRQSIFATQIKSGRSEACKIEFFYNTTSFFISSSFFQKGCFPTDFCELIISFTAVWPHFITAPFLVLWNAPKGFCTSCSLQNSGNIFCWHGYFMIPIRRGIFLSKGYEIRYQSATNVDINWFRFAIFFANISEF